MRNIAKILISMTMSVTLWAGVANAENIFYGLQVEEFEYRAGEHGQDLLLWDADGFVGSDELKLRWKGSGEYDQDGDSLDQFSNQIALQTPISEFWDAKGGIQFDAPAGPDRWSGVVGLSGLAPQWVEVDLDFLVSEKGDASVNLDMEYELLLTNYLILTPSIEISGAFSSDEEIGSGSGVNNIEAGMRLSYDIWDRTLSPYVGVAYERKFGQTADFAQAEDEETKSWQFVIGTKFLF